MEASYQTTEFENGTRVISVEMPHMESVSVGLWAEIGTRHELCEMNGAAHFCEHMLFKGTERRSAKELVMAVEKTGGNRESLHHCLRLGN